MAVLLQTTEGELTVDLFAEEAPYSAYNFLKLCKAKYYNNVAFHRVEKNFLASAGAPLTADARWNVAGLGGVSANFLKLGHAETLVETGKTNTEYVERCGGCSFWGVQALAADKRLTLRLASRPSPQAGHSPLPVKTENSEITKNLTPKKEGNPVPSPSSLTLTKTRVSSSSSSFSDTQDDAALPATHTTTNSPLTSNSTSSSSSTSSTSSSSSTSCPTCTTSPSSASSSSSSSSRLPVRKSCSRKSGWDVSVPSSQQTSYFSFLNFSQVAFPPFPSSPIPDASAALRPPLRVPTSARFCPAEPSGANDVRRRHQKKGMIGWIPSVASAAAAGADSVLQQQHLEGLTAEQQRRLHGEASSLFYVTLRENIDFLDKRNLTLFGCVTEGLDVVEKINQTFVDDRFVPLTVKPGDITAAAAKQEAATAAKN